MPQQLLAGSVADFREDHCTAAAAPKQEDHLIQLSTLFRLNGDNEASLDDDDAIAVDEEEPIITLKYDTYHRARGSSNSSRPAIAPKQEEEGGEEEEPTLQLLRLALVSQHHSLWAEYVYNAARVLADRIDDGRIHCRRMRCLELGE